MSWNIKAFICRLLGKFYGNPWGELNTRFCLNSKKKKNEHWAESYHFKHFYDKSAKTCHELIPHKPLHHYQSHEQFHGLAFGPSSSPGLLPNGGCWVLAIQDGFKEMLLLLISSPREASFPCRVSLCLWHSCFQSVQPLLWIVWILFFMDQYQVCVHSSDININPGLSLAGSSIEITTLWVDAYFENPI